MVYAAGDLRDTIKAAWGLTGRLDKTETDTHKNIVQFFGFPQRAGGAEWAKVIEVKKINTDVDENRIIHPHFDEVTDRYEITCKYRVLGADDVMYDEAESDIEDMTEEINRILDTTYNPSGAPPISSFFTTNKQWFNRDVLKNDQPELVRYLSFTLTQIQSQSEFVYRGFGGVLAWDTASTGDNKRGANYTYTEADNVRIGPEGYPVTNRMSRLSSPNPIKVRRAFRGTFTANMYAKKQDLSDAFIDQVDNIYLAQANGELATTVFLHANDSQETVPTTLTTTTTLMVTGITKDATDAHLVKYTITGELTKPTTVAIT